jgi:lysozyme
MTDRLTAADAALIASVKLGEGLRLRSYPDPLTGGAPWTIGYGHTGADIGPRMSCSEIDAENWLEDDLSVAMAGLDLQERWWRDLPPDGQRVIVELVFNMGLAHLRGFHRFLNDLQAGRFALAAAELMDSLWATQVKSRSARLAARIAALAGNFPISAESSSDAGADLTRKALEA